MKAGCRWRRAMAPTGMAINATCSLTPNSTPLCCCKGQERSDGLIKMTGRSEVDAAAAGGGDQEQDEGRAGRSAGGPVANTARPEQLRQNSTKTRPEQPKLLGQRSSSRLLTP
ncbi:hypothetical protein NDU88_000525 [Pleurodeles waltl]|uniref:Uncharacterized protein n=1 Tax=Pleurodeles waltl TaxID=8319 RepID=A0AAV7N872_PLEWA|nr:hypothetical protein NDU88_000525 [Pleurodeles waltl]